MLPRHCIGWPLLLAPTVREILVSYQKTFLERHRIGPGKRSHTRHPLVGKALSYFLLCTSSWQRTLSGIWSMSLLAAPSRPTTPRLERGCWEAVGWIADSRLATESLSWRSKPRLQTETLQSFPRSVAKGYEQISFSELQFSHLLTKYFDAFRWKAIQVLLHYQTLFHPLSGYKLQLLPKNVGTQVFFMVF